MVIVTKLRETLSKFPRYSLDAVRRKSIKCFHRVLAKIGDHAAAVRCFLEEVHTYTELVDGFRNVVDKQRHVVERYVDLIFSTRDCFFKTAKFT